MLLYMFTDDYIVINYTTDDRSLSEPNLLQGLASTASATSVQHFYHNPLD